MPDTVVAGLADILIEALTAANNSLPPAPALQAAIRAQAPVRIDDLGFDSLRAMEFCISIELQTGAELTPERLDGLVTLEAVARWIDAWRRGRR